MTCRVIRWATSASICLILLVFAAVQSAQAQTKEFNVPAQSATTGIPEFARQAGIQILVSETLVRGKKTAAVSGALTVERALSILLQGTGLTANSKDGATFTLSTLPPPTTSFNPPTPREDEAQKREGLEEIVVTGTLIHNVAPITPVTTITHDDIVAQGYTTLAQVIEQLPQNFMGGGTSPSSNPVNGVGGNNAAANSTYASGINLLGLGGNSTLVLLNGRRMAQTAYGGAVDISQIPVSVIDRVEILTDGASALYGSDAVAGVVNIITKRDYSGFEFGSRVTGISDGKTPNYGGDVVGGFSWGSGGLVMSADYEKENPLFARNRSFSDTLPNPWGLTPEDEAIHLFASLNQQLTDRATFSLDTLVTRRTYQENVVFGGVSYVGNGTVKQYNLSPQLDYAISSDWTATLIGQWSKEQDFTLATYSPPEPISAYTPLDYQVAYIEPRVEGKLFSLPGGAARLAVGGSIRDEKFYFGNFNSFFGVAEPPEAFEKSRHVTSAYGELMVPIVGHNNAMPFVRELRIDVSGRYDHYSDFGGTTNPKVGISWTPADDLTIHATYARSFQAPSLYELLEPQTPSLIVAPGADPQSPTGSSLVLEPYLRNPNLQPETAKSLNVGFSYDPSYVPGLKIDASYFAINFDDQITNVYQEGICEVAYTCTLQDQAALGSLFQRNPSLAQVEALLNTPNVITYNYAGGNYSPALYTPGDIKAIANIGLLNAASTIIRGVYLTPSFTSVLTSLGRFRADLNASYYIDYDQHITSAAPSISIDNKVYNPLRFRAKANVGWEKNGWAANARVNFANSYTNNLSYSNCPNTCTVSSWTTFDVGLSYAVQNGSDWTWLRGIRFAVIANNVFDRQPPLVTTLGDNFGYDPVNADPLLRTISVTFTKRWGAEGSR